MNLKWSETTKVSKKEFEAIKKITDLTNVCIEQDESGNCKVSSNLIQDAIDHDIITLNECRNGRDAVWYLDETVECCVYIDTLEELSQEDIEKELM